jgi:glutamyl-tRNA synthetase
MTTRTRFAPSPTGFMHVGNVRSALYPWLVARHSGGQFVLRIEDTDKVREVEGSALHIMQSLKWLGIAWDESIDVGGPHEPYLQSERLETYRKWAQKLIDTGRAYADPYSKEELEAFRNEAKAAKKPFLFRDHRPQNPGAWDGTQPLRFKSEPKAYAWTDAVLGDLHAGSGSVHDFILMKSDGYPTYNFAHIVDDSEMGITHVLRSQEYTASVPKYLNLYEALGLRPPVLATLPFVMAIDGKKKLSKRDGAKDILAYRDEGYLPEAMVNFLATLGWNDGSEQEVFSVSELIEKFSFDRVQKSPARFDEQRLLWLNGQWIRRLSVDELFERVTPFWGDPAGASEDYKLTVLELIAERLKTLADVPLLSDYFFTEPTPDWSMVDANKQLSRVERSEQLSLLTQAAEALEKVDFQTEALTEVLNKLLSETAQKPAVLFSLIRFALTWAPFSPGLAETMTVLGKEKTLARMHAAIDAQ